MSIERAVCEGLAADAVELCAAIFEDGHEDFKGCERASVSYMGEYEIL